MLFKPVYACDRYTLYSETVSDPGYESEEERLPTSALIKPPARQVPSVLSIVCNLGQIRLTSRSFLAESRRDFDPPFSSIWCPGLSPNVLGPTSKQLAGYLVKNSPNARINLARCRCTLLHSPIYGCCNRGIFLKFCPFYGSKGLSLHRNYISSSRLSFWADSALFYVHPPALVLLTRISVNIIKEKLWRKRNFSLLKD